MSSSYSAAAATRAPSSSAAVPTVSLYGSTTGIHDLSGTSLPQLKSPGKYTHQNYSSNLGSNPYYTTQHQQGQQQQLHQSSQPQPQQQPGASTTSAIPFSSEIHSQGINRSAGHLADPRTGNTLSSSLLTRMESLTEQVQQREAVISAQNQTLDRMRDDYQHNLKVLESRDEEIKQLHDRKAALERDYETVQNDLATAVGRSDALAATLADVDAAHEQNTKHLKEQLEAHKAQNSILLGEKANLQRIVSERDMEIATLREEAQHLRSNYTRQLESERRKFQQDFEEALQEQHKQTLMKEEQLHVDKKKLETRTAEIFSELARVKDTQVHTEMQKEEFQKLAASRESTMNHLQQQINEIRRASKQREADLESEVASLRAAREQAERSGTTHHLTLSRDLDKKTHEVELLEQKVAALRTQHEAELKRRSDLYDEHMKEADQKRRLAEEKQRSADSRALELNDLCERLKRQTTELKRDVDASDMQNGVLKEKVEELERALHRRDQNWEKAESDVKKLTALLNEKEKEIALTRTEMHRREQRDRAVKENQLQNQSESWKQSFPGEEPMITDSGDYSSSGVDYEHLNQSNAHGAATTAIGGSRRGRTMEGTSLNASPVYRSPQGRARSARRKQQQQHGEESGQTLELLNDIKNQLSSQHRDVTSAAVQSANRSTRDAAEADYFDSMTAAHDPNRAATAALRRELAVMRESYANDREELEEKLEDAMREIARERKRTQRLESQVNETGHGMNVSREVSFSSAAPPAAPAHSPARPRQDLSATAGGDESPSLHRLRQLKADFQAKAAQHQSQQQH